MRTNLLKNIPKALEYGSRSMFTGSSTKESCRVLILGGGTGGCTIASRFAGKLGQNKVIIVDPADRHYYQPMFTLIGGGIKTLDESYRPMGDVLPTKAKWIKDKVSHIEAKNNLVMTENGTEISYDFLVVAIGLELRYDKVSGLEEALNDPSSGVCSNYSPQYVERTFKFLQKTKSGNAIFTFPNTPVKCAGAPLKACLISEDYLRKENRRNNVEVFYRTSLPVVFSVKHYADKLMEICKNRNVDVGLKQELKSINLKSKQATFHNLERPAETITMDYSFLHVTPPMAPPPVLKSSPDLSDDSGFLSINRSTLKHNKFANIYGIGDCTSLPTSKTAAAVAAQSGVVAFNLSADLEGRKVQMERYDGYTSCPLVTGYGSCIMAEFDYNLERLETFPIDQSIEHKSMYTMKKDILPFVYWNAMLKGFWSGPKAIRKILHLGMGK